MINIAIIIVLKSNLIDSEWFLLCSVFTILGSLLSLKWIYHYYLDMSMKDIEVDLIWFIVVILGIYFTNFIVYLSFIIVFINLLQLLSVNDSVSTKRIKEFPIKILTLPMMFLVLSFSIIYLYIYPIIYMLMVVALLIPIGIFITRIIKHRNDSEYAFSKFKNIILIILGTICFIPGFYSIRFYPNDFQLLYGHIAVMFLIMIIPFTILEHQRKAIIYEGVLEKKSDF